MYDRGRIIISFAVFLLLSAPVYSQHNLGFIGGLNFSDLDLPGRPAAGRTLFGFGGTYDYDFSNNFTLHIEGLFLQKGGVIGLPDPGPDVKLRSGFFELPIFLKASLGDDIRPYIIMGPSFGLLLSSSVEAEIEGETYSAGIQSITSGLDLGFAAGAGVDYRFGDRKFFFQGRYTYSSNRMRIHGIAELEGGDTPETVYFANQYYKNKGLQILAGITFPINVE